MLRASGAFTTGRKKEGKKERVNLEDKQIDRLQDHVLVGRVVGFCTISSCFDKGVGINDALVVDTTPGTHFRVHLNSSKMKSTRFWGGNVKIDFRTLFSDLVQNACSVRRCSCLLRLSTFCKALQNIQRSPQKCQKIAGCRECAVYASRPPIASKPGLFSPESTSLDNITSQPWSDAISPRTTASSTLSYLFQTQRA